MQPIVVVVQGKDDLSPILDAVAKATEGFGRKVGGAGKETDKSSQVMVGALRKVGEYATTGLVKAGEALASFAVNAVKQAGDFEAGMNRFASVTGSAIEEAGFTLSDFQDKFLQLGAETQFSAAQAQDAAIALAKGGVSVASIMNDATQATLDLAAAGELDLAPAAEIVAKQLGVWADTGVTAANVADLMAQAANASTVDVDELAMGLSQVGGVAKVAGVSFDDLTTTMALLAPGFGSASDAGTSLKTMLLNLQPKSDDAAAAMKKLGLLTADGTNAFYDASGSLKDMGDVAEILQNSLEGLSEQEKTAALNAIFGTDAYRAAAFMAEAGAEGFDNMAASMAAAGTAAEQAAKRNQGFNFALDSLMGSMETLGIVAGQQLLPVLTELINTIAIPAVNAVTEFAKGMGDVSAPAHSIASTIGALVIPAMTGLAAATAAYAITQIPSAIAAVTAFIPKLAAQAAAAWAATGPFILLGAAIAGVTYAWQQFDGKVKSATQSLLESRQWWNDSTDALNKYNSASKETQDKLSAHAATIRELRSEIEGEVEDLGRRMAAGMVSDEQYQREMDAINAKREGLIRVTDSMDKELAALVAQQAASATATTALAQVTQGNAQLASQVQLTEEDLDKLQKKLTDTYEKGGQAVEDYTTTQGSFLAEATAAQQQHDADALASLAARYAEEAAAQQAHLGQMLADYTVAQVQMGNISAEKGAEITAQIGQEFGAQQSLSQTTFLQMAADIDRWAQEGGQSAAELASDLHDTADTAVDTKAKMEELAKKYEAELVHNFQEGKISADELSEALKAIPERVYSEVVTRHIDIYETRGDNTQASQDNPAAGYRAAGGPVAPRTPYIVGERGPELFVPDSGGRIIPNHELERDGDRGTPPIVINVTINPSQGMDERQLADLVMRQIEQRISMRRV